MSSTSSCAGALPPPSEFPQPANTTKKYVPLIAGTLITFAGTAAAATWFVGATTVSSVALPYIAAIGLSLGLILITYGCLSLRAEASPLDRAANAPLPRTPSRPATEHPTADTTPPGTSLQPAAEDRAAETSLQPGPPS